MIVDNGGASRAGVSRAEIESLWPGAALLVNASNRGLGPASNQAAAAARGDVLLFLNPDTRAEGEPFTPIARAFESDARVAAVAPRLIDMNGPGSDPSATTRTRLAPPGREDQRTFQLRRLPTLVGDARELLLIDHLAPDNPGRRRARYADADREASFAGRAGGGGGARGAAAARSRRSAGSTRPTFPRGTRTSTSASGCGREGTIRYLPDARFRHRGGESATRLGYDRFLPIFYAQRAALPPRALSGSPARAAYRGLARRRDAPAPRGPAAAPLRPAPARRGRPRLPGASSACRSASAAPAAAATDTPP